MHRHCHCHWLGGRGIAECFKLCHRNQTSLDITWLLIVHLWGISKSRYPMRPCGHFQSRSDMSAPERHRIGNAKIAIYMNHIIHPDLTHFSDPSTWESPVPTSGAFDREVFPDSSPALDNLVCSNMPASLITLTAAVIVRARRLGLSLASTSRLSGRSSRSGVCICRAGSGAATASSRRHTCACGHRSLLSAGR